MLTLTTDPGTIRLSRNQIPLRIAVTDSSGQPYGPVGASAGYSAVIGTTQRLTAGQTITFQFTEQPSGGVQSIVFTATATPTDPEHLPVGAGTVNAAYISQINTIIFSHPQVQPFFSGKMTSAGTTRNIRLTANDATENWLPSFSTTSGFGILAPTAPVADNTPFNHKIHVDVFFEKNYKSGGWSRVAQLTPAPDAAGIVTVDMSSILDNECRFSVIRPILGQNFPVRAANTFRYFFRYAESSGTASTFGPIVASTVRTVINGGVDQLISNFYNYYEEISGENSLLTFTPSKSVVGPRQPQWLSWKNYTQTPITAWVQKREQHNDGTFGPNSINFSANPVTLQPHEAGTFPVGPEQLDLAAETRRYEVRIMTAAGEVSPWYAYEVDCRIIEDQRVLCYLNQFGVPETLRCTGRWSLEHRIDRNVADTWLRLDYAPDVDIDSVQWGDGYEPVFTFRTGFIRRADAIHAAGWLQSAEVCEVLPGDEYYYMHLQIESARVVSATETGQTLHFIEVKATRRLSARNAGLTDFFINVDWNPVPVETTPPPPPPPQQNGWLLPNGTDEWLLPDGASAWLLG